MSLCAHEGDSHGEDEQQPTTRVLGKISFPTTTRSEQAQAAFVEGMLLLHLFEYPFAQERFQAAQQLDPGFAMAYWGEAMTHNHPIWDEQDREAALEVLNRLGASPEARQSKTTAQKEKDYLAALDVLYGEGARADRDQAYLRHMQQMALHYPQDHEVQLFYALSLFGAHAGVRNVPAYMQSTAISQRVFYANREHPGAAHYLIHGVDDPVHAPLGLEAARALAVMAPDAGHSLHMTSHIFTAVGMWNDVIEANQAAVRKSNQMALSRGGHPRHWGHYNFWLLYGLLQQGRHIEAGKMLRTAYAEAADAVPGDPLELDPDNEHINSVVQMWARYMIETRGRDRDIATWKFELGDAFDPRLNFHYVLSIDAAWQENPALAGQHLEQFRDLKSGLEKAIFALERQAPSDLLYLDRLAVMEQELQALLAYAGKNTDAAIGFASEASILEGKMPFAFGPPFVDFPSAELLGLVLLDAGLYAAAADAFRLQLERTRLKSIPLLGLVQAGKKLQDQGTAQQADQMLRANWTEADSRVSAQLDLE